MNYEVVVRRVGGMEAVLSTHGGIYPALDAQADAVCGLRQRGFVGGLNAAGIVRLSKRENGRRVRLAVFVRKQPSFSLN